MKLDGKNIQNQSNERQDPTIRLSGADHTIEPEQTIGQENHLVNIVLQDDHTINIQTHNFHAALKTSGDHIGTANFQRVASGNQSIVYGLGDKDNKLKEVNIDNNTNNRGNTYTYLTNVRARYNAGGTIAGTVKLGEQGMLILKDDINLVGNIENDDSLRRAVNPVIFEGNSRIVGNIGKKDNPMVAVNFRGDRKEQKLSGSIYADTIEFNNNDIILSESAGNVPITLSGTTHIDGTINLGANKLILDQSYWGPNIAIMTTLNQYDRLGSIEVKTSLNIVEPNKDLPLIVNDDLTLPSSGDPEQYLFIDQNIDNIALSNIGRGQAYAEWGVERENNSVILTRTNKARRVVKRDVQAAGGDNTDLQNVQNLVSASGGDALSLTTDIGKSADEKTRGEKGIKNTSGNTEALASMYQAHMTASHSVLLGRLNTNVLSYISGVGIGAGDEGPPKANIGTWVMPIYSHANQKQKHVSKPSYAVKTLGGIGGLDVALNNNLTLGAAISVINSEVKYKNLKVGDKMSTKTIMLSVYGAQKLTDQLFVEGVASYGSTQIGNRELRPFSFGEQIAKANYESIAYGGEVLMGYNAVFNNSVLLTPVAGMSYIKSRDDAYIETGTTFANKTVDACSISRTDGVVGTRVSTSMNIQSNMIVIPEAHAMLSHYLGGKAGKFIAILQGAPQPFSRINDIVKTIYNLGVSISSKSNNIEYGLGYDAHLANKYVAHQGSLKVRLNF
ncbi:unnamed protein product [Didymodactylos carnosus]|uniref:Outer membrane protein B n=1 Tax=Didymodactylos carnosus TaxID=1234261 RepID=A0A813Q3J3_9BILA|nr:unnamed protein product [Didymodactylos carnosus]CAF0761530.1 unnamed protein product [Didymodactylos carnosus]CAF3542386.1 unnamed protein product [Didymodactylos carnosus]CAF3542455.1 unnamed protein product [Didymodactylos carnosus]